MALLRISDTSSSLQIRTDICKSKTDIHAKSVNPDEMLVRIYTVYYMYSFPFSPILLETIQNNLQGLTCG